MRASFVIGIALFFLVSFSLSGNEAAKPLAYTDLDRAVAWLIAQQGDDGFWRSAREGNSAPELATAFAIDGLCFRPTPSAQASLTKAVDALLASQSADGRFSTNDVVHTLVTRSLNHYLESRLPLYLLKRDAVVEDARTKTIKTALRKAMEVIFRLQDPVDGHWKSDNLLFSDLALTCLNIQCAISAKRTSLFDRSISTTLSAADTWLAKRPHHDDRAIAEENPDELAEDVLLMNTRGIFLNSKEKDALGPVAMAVTQRFKTGLADTWLLCLFADSGGSFGWNSSLSIADVNKSFSKQLRDNGSITAQGRVSESGGQIISTSLMLWALRFRQGTCTGW